VKLISVEDTFTEGLLVSKMTPRTLEARLFSCVKFVVTFSLTKTSTSPGLIGKMFTLKVDGSICVKLPVVPLKTVISVAINSTTGSLKVTTTGIGERLVAGPATVVTVTDGGNGFEKAMIAAMLKITVVNHFFDECKNELLFRSEYKKEKRFIRIMR
jgi:hypothetical protein